MLTAPCGHQTVCKRSLYTSVLYFGSLDYVGCNKGFSEGMCQKKKGDCVGGTLKSGHPVGVAEAGAAADFFNKFCYCD
jgi:hypothetical protein